MSRTRIGRPTARGTPEKVSETTNGESTHPGAGLCPPGGCRAVNQAREELAAELAFDAGRRYERAAMAELARLKQPRKPVQLDHAWKPVHRPWEEQVALRAATYGPSKPVRYDDPDWPPVAVPGAGIRLGPNQAIQQGAAPW